MTENEYRALFGTIMDIGKAMLISGAEIYRVEDSIIRLIKAYGGTSGQVNAVPSHIVASVTFEGREYTLMRRVEANETDLELLHRLNDLSRKICRETPPPEMLPDMLKAAQSVKSYTSLQFSLIYALVGAAFTLFFGGAWLDALISAVISCGIYWLRRMILNNGGNRVFVALFCSAFGALLSRILTLPDYGANVDIVIIGVVMVLIPGSEMVNGFRDFSAGDIQAGLMHIAEALFLGVMIAVGAAGVFMLMQSMGL